MRIRLRSVTLLALAGFMWPGAHAAAQVRRYLYQLDTRSGDPLFAGQVPMGPALDAAYAEVTTDTLGRVTRVVWLWDGKKTSELVYHFAPGEKLADGYEAYAATGEMTSRRRIFRNPDGVRTRIETASLTGALTGYLVRSIGATEIEETAYTTAGKRIDRTVNTYSGRGVVIRSRWYPEDSVYYESEIDSTTGLSQSRRKVVGGQVVSSDKYTYDPYGDETRDDIYDADGNWYGAREYSEGLLRVERYKFADGTTQEARTQYDEDRRSTEASFQRNGQLVCTFKFDRLPTGQIKRTLAVGPDGALLAEYPDVYVNKVTKDGHPVDHPEVGTIYKRGDWW